MRAICRMRSRSTARDRAVPVQAIASRCTAEGDTPAAAFSFQAACAGRVARAATTTVRRSARSAPVRGSGGAAPVRLVLRQRRETPGVRRGAQPPLASPNVRTLGRLSYRPKWPW